MHAGARDVISKPFDLLEVKTRIHNMLEVRLLYKELARYNEVLEQTVRERTAALAESEARYRRLTQLASDWHWEEDGEGRLLNLSGPAMEMLGLPVEAPPGAALFMAATGWDETQREALRKLIANRQPFLDFVFSRAGADGVRQRFRVSGGPSSTNRAASSATAASGSSLPRMASTRSRAASVDTFHDPRKNHLLAALPPPDFAAIAASLEPVTLRLGDALYASGVPLQHAYFPGTAIVSLHYVTTSGASSGTAGVGHGVVGVPLHGRRQHAGVRRGADRRLGVSADRTVLQREFDHAGAAAAAVALPAGAHRADHADRRVQPLSLGGAATVPLAAADARPHPFSELTMTQELIGSMLGVRREGITEAAGKLQAAGHIGTDGHIAVLNRAGLNARACECYGVVKKETGRLMVSTHHHDASGNHP